MAHALPAQPLETAPVLVLRHRLEHVAMGLRQRLAERNTAQWRAVDPELDARLSQPVTPAPVERPAPEPKPKRAIPRIALMGPIDAPVGPPKPRKQQPRGRLPLVVCACGTSFAPVRMNQVHCSRACRMRRQMEAERAKKVGIGFGFRCTCGANMPVSTTSAIEGGLVRYRTCQSCGAVLITEERAR